MINSIVEQVVIGPIGAFVCDEETVRVILSNEINGQVVDKHDLASVWRKALHNLRVSFMKIIHKGDVRYFTLISRL